MTSIEKRQSERRKTKKKARSRATVGKVAIRLPPSENTVRNYSCIAKQEIGALCRQAVYFTRYILSLQFYESPRVYALETDSSAKRNYECKCGVSV